jgi:hypothetical protein
MIRTLAAVVLAGAMLSAPAVSASGAEADHAAGNQKFIVLQTDPNADGGTVVAMGPIHAVGEDIVMGEFKDKFKFEDGSLIITHKPKKGSTHETFDEVTCYFTFSEKGTWKVAKGTGAYADMTGGGTYKVNGQGIGCDEKAPPEEFAVMITAVGDLATP